MKILFNLVLVLMLTLPVIADSDDDDEDKPSEDNTCMTQGIDLKGGYHA